MLDCSSMNSVRPSCAAAPITSRAAASLARLAVVVGNPAQANLAQDRRAHRGSVSTTSGQVIEWDGSAWQEVK